MASMLLLVPFLVIISPLHGPVCNESAFKQCSIGTCSALFELSCWPIIPQNIIKQTLITTSAGVIFSTALSATQMPLWPPAPRFQACGQTNSRSRSERASRARACRTEQILRESWENVQVRTGKSQARCPKGVEDRARSPRLAGGSVGCGGMQRDAAGSDHATCCGTGMGWTPGSQRAAAEGRADAHVSACTGLIWVLPRSIWNFSCTGKQQLLIPMQFPMAFPALFLKHLVVVPCWGRTRHWAWANAC